MEIRDCIAYLRLIAFDDNEDFERIINKPKRMFGKTKLEKLKALAEEEGLSYYEALKRHIDLPDFKRSSAEAFVMLIEEMRAKYKTSTIADIVSEVLDKSGYERYIRENGSMERLDNLAEFKRSCTDEERSRGEEYSLEEFLSDIAVRAETDSDEEKRDRVKLMTIHASKGLEFPVCFICGMTEGVFPSGRTVEERKEAGMEEERRLCFVALTRAMKRLYLTESEGNMGESSRGGNKKRPSRFVYEIGEENYKRIGEIPKELKNNSPTADAEEKKTNRLDVGSEVDHPVFGHGKVVDIDEKRGVYNIKFDKAADVKPVGMDYDFEKWRGIAEMKKKALEAAAEKSANVENAPALSKETEKAPESKKSTDEQIKIEFADDVPHEDSREPETVEISVPEKYELPEKYRNAEWLKSIDLGEENLWKRDDVPHEGWHCVGVIDLGSPTGICRMCGYQIIRYVHIMEHPSFPRKIGAGCICAGKMEGNVEAARERENAFKNRQGRMETFLSTKLKKSKNGNEYFKYKGEIVTIIPDRFKPGYYKSVFRNVFSDPHPTKESALLDVFDKIDPPIEY